jgi:hypothetical protein
VNFEELLRKAKASDRQAVEHMLKMYQPLMMKEAIVNGVLDEDLLQELQLVFIQCIRQFDVQVKNR